MNMVFSQNNTIPKNYYFEVEDRNCVANFIYPIRLKGIVAAYTIEEAAEKVKESKQIKGVTYTHIEIYPFIF